MKKLTALEILQIVEDNYSVEDFAHGEFLSTKTDLKVPETIGSLEKERREAFWEQIKDLPNVRETEAFKEYSKMPNKWVVQRLYILNKLGLGEIKEIHSTGGEDEGSDWSSVKYFKEHDVYIKTDGYYQSFHGTDFNHGYGKQVFPKIKNITYYE